MPDAQKRVLILSASAGNGHMRAADALLKDFQNRPDVAEVQHWDFLQYTNAVFRTIYSKMYMDLIGRAPWVLGMAYKATDKPWKSTLPQAFEKFSAGPFIDALRTYAPDVIVATHFTPPNVLAWLHGKRKLGTRIPAPAIVVTDLDCHAMWLSRHYSHYFVWLEETAVYLERMGIDADRITRSGIPMDPVFRVPIDKEAAKAALGLQPKLPVVLVSAGGLGEEGGPAVMRELATMPLPSQVVFIAGKSAALKTKLDATLSKLSTKGASTSTTVVGFTTQMHQFMAAADLLVTKPGGLTVAEAMTRGLPLCIVNPIPGQEERNADHLLEAGVAIKCNNAATMGWKVAQLLQDFSRLSMMRDRARKLAKPQAGQTIIDATLGPPPGKPTS